MLSIGLIRLRWPWKKNSQTGIWIHVDRRKLSAIYQFAQAMPSLFVPVPHVKGVDKKRKRKDA